MVEHLSAPVILGCDFMTKQGLVMDFEQVTFHSKESPDHEGRLQLHIRVYGRRVVLLVKLSSTPEVSYSRTKLK